MKKIVSLLLVLAMILCFAACTVTYTPKDKEILPDDKELPVAQVDSESQFGTDKNITIKNIDEWLGRTDTVYRDMRLLFDPADYAAIGGDADLSVTIKGFKVTPFPYIGTLQALPVDGAYDGTCLYTIEWNEDGTIASATPNYEESEMIMKELFPQDKNIFLICGGGGYAGMTRTLLIFLGWDESKVYNVGAAWQYEGENGLELIVYPEKADGTVIDATWRADYAYIDFDRLHEVEE